MLSREGRNGKQEDWKGKRREEDRRANGYLPVSDRIITARVSNPGFTEPENPGNPEIFQTQKKRVWAACKPGFSGLNFDLKMSNYALIITQ